MKKIKNLMIAIIAVYAISFVVVNILHKVPAGHRGVLDFFGYVYPKSYPSGLVKTIPCTKVVLFDEKEKALPYDLSMKTGETHQNVHLHGVLNYSIDGNQAHIIYQKVGEDFQGKIVIPKLEQALNEVIGKNSPELIVTEREMVREAVLYVLNDRLPEEGFIQIKDLSVIDPKFDPEVEKAIADKAVAMQIAAKAKYDTQRVEEEAKQMRLRLEAEAHGLDLRSKALKNPLIVKYEYAKRWRGEVPSTIMVGQENALPIIGISK